MRLRAFKKSCFLGTTCIVIYVTSTFYCVTRREGKHCKSNLNSYDIIIGLLYTIWSKLPFNIITATKTESKHAYHTLLRSHIVD